MLLYLRHKTEKQTYKMKYLPSQRCPMNFCQYFPCKLYIKVIYKKHGIYIHNEINCLLPMVVKEHIPALSHSASLPAQAVSRCCSPCLGQVGFSVLAPRAYCRAWCLGTYHLVFEIVSLVSVSPLAHRAHN